MKIPVGNPANRGGFPPALARLAEQAGAVAAPRPVERWDPPYCGEIDMRIDANGGWFYRGSPIRRDGLVRLFASILRREPDGSHVLVTPAEKVGIVVEDAPFLAVEVLSEGSAETRRLTFRTNVGDLVAAGPDHPLRFEAEPRTGGLKPYLLVRHGLDALLTRAVTHELAATAYERGGALGLWSDGVFFAFPEPGR
jgi:hypothetical protein